MKQSVKLDAQIDKARELANAGKLIQARELLTKVLRKDPQNGRAKDGVRAITAALQKSDPHRQLRAQIIDHLKNGRAPFALPLAQELVRLAPKDGSAANLLGMAHGSIGKSADAAHAFEKACKISPNESGHWFNLGKARLDLDQPKLAIDAFQKAHELNSDHLPTSLALGKAYMDHGHYAKGAKHLDWMNRTYPGNVSILVNLVQAWYHLGKIDTAETVLAEALDKFPDDSDLLTTLGQILRAKGEFDAARAKFDTVLAQKPDYAPAHLGRSSVTKFKQDDPQITALEDLVKSDLAKGEAGATYWFALGKAYEDIDERQQAFDAYLKGNAMRKSTLRAGMPAERTLFKSLKALDIARWPKQEFPSHSKSIRPIFIVGMPRSGTSLVEQILSRHSKVSAAGELTTLAHAIADVYPELQRGPLPQTIAALRDAYFDEAGEFVDHRRIVTDKMPLNFRWIGIAAAAFPEAKFVNLNRDPMAVAWSIFKRNLDGGGNRFAFDLEEIAEFTHMYLDIMDHWRKTCPNFILDVDYEKLTESPESEIRNLLLFLDLEWEAACLSPEKSKRAVITSSDTQLRKGIYSGSSEDWRKFAEFLAPWADKFPQARK